MSRYQFIRPNLAIEHGQTGRILIDSAWPVILIIFLTKEQTKNHPFLANLWTTWEQIRNTLFIRLFCWGMIDINRIH